MSESLLMLILTEGKVLTVTSSFFSPPVCPAHTYQSFVNELVRNANLPLVRQFPIPQSH